MNVTEELEKLPKAQRVLASILREPPVPELSDKAIELLTELCFGNQDPLEGKGEAAIIFGTSSITSRYACVEQFRYAYGEIGFNTVYITGGMKCDLGIESEVIRDLIKPENYPHVKFKVDIRSRNTKENVERAMDLGLGKHRKIVFITKWHHSGRCRLTLEKFLPQAMILQRGFTAILQKAPGTISPDFWPKDSTHRARVWGEFLRIEEYGRRGEINYPDHVREKVRLIHELCSGHA